MNVIHKADVAEAATLLATAVAEASYSLRIASFNKAYDVASPAVQYLVNIVMSFQVLEAMRVYVPKFNTIEYYDIMADISAYFNNQSQVTFHSMPYVSQLLLYFAGASNIKVPLLHQMKMNYTYLDVPTFINIEDTIKCHLCGTPYENDQLCPRCLSAVQNRTLARSTSFKWAITHDSAKDIIIPTGYFGDINLRLELFQVTRTDTYTLNFKYVGPKDGKRIQLTLPFTEFQWPI